MPGTPKGDKSPELGLLSPAVQLGAVGARRRLRGRRAPYYMLVPAGANTVLYTVGDMSTRPVPRYTFTRPSPEAAEPSAEPAEQEEPTVSVG